MNPPTPLQVLDTPMDRNNAGAATVGEFLVALLFELWATGELFSAKRPFGSSGWHYNVYAALVKAGHITGSFDADGCLDECDDEAGDQLIRAAIKSIGGLS